MQARWYWGSPHHTGNLPWSDGWTECGPQGLGTWHDGATSAGWPGLEWAQAGGMSVYAILRLSWWDDWSWSGLALEGSWGAPLWAALLGQLELGWLGRRAPDFLCQWCHGAMARAGVSQGPIVLWEGPRRPVTASALYAACTIKVERQQKRWFLLESPTPERIWTVPQSFFRHSRVTK